MSLPEDKLLHRYDVGKWTIKEVIVHLVDLERIYSYRALRFARKDPIELPGFDGDRYVLASRANERAVSNLLAEYETVRQATVSMAEGFDEEALAAAGVANGHRVTVATLLYHIAGHEMHHVQIIKERYLR